MVSFLLGLTSNPEHSIANHGYTNFSDEIHIMMLMIGNDPFGEFILWICGQRVTGRPYPRSQ